MSKTRWTERKKEEKTEEGKPIGKKKRFGKRKKENRGFNSIVKKGKKDRVATTSRWEGSLLSMRYKSGRRQCIPKK